MGQLQLTRLAGLWAACTLPQIGGGCTPCFLGRSPAPLGSDRAGLFFPAAETYVEAVGVGSADGRDSGA